MSSGAQLAYQSHYPSRDRFLSRSVLVESRYEGLPTPWGRFSANSRADERESPPPDSTYRQSDLDQDISRQVLAEESRSHLLNNPSTQFSPGEETPISPAAMFLSAFSPATSFVPSPDDEGQVVSGYVLGPVIGRGGFSTIRRASSASGGVVAVKIVRRIDMAKQADPSLARKRLDHEASVWESLSHEHILPLFSAEHTSFGDFFITLLCPAGSLFDILKRDGNPALPHDDAGMMFRQVVRGVRYLHETAGYVHRDMKLENVLVDEMGVCRIGDFGMAQKIGDSGDDEVSQDGDPTAIHRHRSTISHTRRQVKTQLPVHRSLIRHHGGPRHRTSTPIGNHVAPPVHPAHVFQSGSLPYAAPELLSPQVSLKPSPANPAQDMWALGVMLYALLTGRLPFADSFEPRLQMKILHGVYDVPSGIGRGAERVLRGCLERSVRSRWTIAMVDEMAWGIGWGEVDDTSSVSHEDEFEFVDYPSHRSASHSKSRSRSRACNDNASPLEAARHPSSHHNRSLSRTSVATSASFSTRSTSRSVSRPPPPAHYPLSPTYDDLTHSVLSTSSSLYSPPSFDIAGSPQITSPITLERGRQPKKARARSPSLSLVPTTPEAFSAADHFPDPVGEGPSDYDHEGLRRQGRFDSGTDMYAGRDAFDNTARWASAVDQIGTMLDSRSGVSPCTETLAPRAYERLRAIQMSEQQAQIGRRAESTPPAPSVWPRRARPGGKGEVYIARLRDSATLLPRSMTAYLAGLRICSVRRMKPELRPATAVMSIAGAGFASQSTAHLYLYKTSSLQLLIEKRKVFNPPNPAATLDDLVRLQQVSKTFFDITQHRAVWSDAYESSVLPRPPGPFAWQSSSYLRSTLVTSAKVDRNWPPHEASRFSSRDIVLSRTEYRFSLVFGRWFFAASSSTVRCFDLDSEDGSGQRVHGVQRDDGATIASFWCAGIAVPDGPLAFSACIEATRISTSEVDYVIKVFKLIFLEGSAVKFELVQEIPTGLQNLDYIDLTPQGLIIQARGPVADRHSHIWVMDIRTYRLYKLSTPPLDGRRSWHIAKTWRAHQSDRITLLAVENKRCVLAHFTLAPSLNAEEKGTAQISFDTQAISAFPPVLKRGTDLRLQSVSASGNRRILCSGATDDGLDVSDGWWICPWCRYGGWFG
ncbi:kinase-like protein [Leucogyrophana mollusca]|uniref:Kinase-like protein n=1 Tax=Leucogyrophana mollusca TaxID=85980 RepID=A0ACB8BQ03_9AGAM|nr:kinase-like protein [Leucogyrophana mollusca]